MTQDEIIEMARQAGAYSTFDKDHDCAFELPALIAFAKLVAAKEREACAMVCDELDAKYESVCEMTSVMCAQAIRARGEA